MALFLFFFNDTATTEIYTLSLHDALPISGLCAGAWLDEGPPRRPHDRAGRRCRDGRGQHLRGAGDRKSTRLNSSHSSISYAVFCLKKKKKIQASFVMLMSWPAFTTADGLP